MLPINAVLNPWFMFGEQVSKVLAAHYVQIDIPLFSVALGVGVRGEFNWFCINRWT